MPTPTIENYVKRIWRLGEDSPDGLVALGALAQGLGVTAGTVTSMLKTLSEAGLADYQPRQGVRLTAAGKALALHVLRRHRILELYLVNRLGMDWAEVHEEAEVLEHAVSDKVLECMEAHLSDTSLDPHGSPIPTQEGVLEDLRDLTPLSAVQDGQQLRIAKVREQDASFLDFLARRSLKPGDTARVLRRDGPAGVLLLQNAAREEVTLSLEAARGVEVVCLDG